MASGQGSRPRLQAPDGKWTRKSSKATSSRWQVDKEVVQSYKLQMASGQGSRPRLQAPDGKWTRKSSKATSSRWQVDKEVVQGYKLQMPSRQGSRPRLQAPDGKWTRKSSKATSSRWQMDEEVIQGYKLQMTSDSGRYPSPFCVWVLTPGTKTLTFFFTWPLSLSILRVGADTRHQDVDFLLYLAAISLYSACGC